MFLWSMYPFLCQVVNNYKWNKMQSEKLLDLDMGPKTIDHFCEYSFCGDIIEMEAGFSDVWDWVRSIDYALEEFGSERMEEGGMMDWVGRRKKENILEPREDLHIRGPKWRSLTETDNWGYQSAINICKLLPKRTKIMWFS